MSDVPGSTSWMSLARSPAPSPASGSLLPIETSTKRASGSTTSAMTAVTSIDTSRWSAGVRASGFGVTVKSGGVVSKTVSGALHWAV